MPHEGMRAAAFLLSSLVGLTHASFAGELEKRLADAVRARDAVAVRQLLSEGAKPNERLPDRSLPLAWAIDRQDVGIAQSLLASGADPNATNLYGDPLLASACEGGDEETVLTLLKGGADAKASRSDGISAIAICAGSSSAMAVRVLAQKGADVNGADKKGITPLMRAAAAGAVDNIGILITLGAQIDAKTPEGATAMFYALQSEDSQAPGMLLDAGAATNILTPEGQTTIEAALAVHNEAFASDVIKKGINLADRNKDGWQVVHTLAAGGYTDLVKLAISLGADPNGPTQPPLVPAKVEVAANANAGIADKKEVEKGDPQKKEERLPVSVLIAPTPPSPRTPLMLAAAGGHIETMKALVAAGAKTRVVAPDGLTVTLAAVSSGDISTVSYALELDPNLTATAQGGKTALHLAVRSSNTQGAEALLPVLVEKGVKLDAKDSRGITAGEIVNRAGPANLRTAYNKLLKDHGLPIPERKFSVD